MLSFVLNSLLLTFNLGGVFIYWNNNDFADKNGIWNICYLRNNGDEIFKLLKCYGMVVHFYTVKCFDDYAKKDVLEYYLTTHKIYINIDISVSSADKDFNLTLALKA